MTTIRIRGDFQKLQQWVQKLDDLGRHDVLRTINRACAEEAISLIRDGFREERAPDGRPWKELKLRKGRILQDTNRLRNSFHVAEVTADGFRVSGSAKYAVFHQRGTGIYGPSGTPIRPVRAKVLAWRTGGKRYVARSVKGVPPRPMVPEGKLPQRWLDPLIETAEEILADHFR